jgi:FAD:protein FMN transferase
MKPVSRGVSRRRVLGLVAACGLPLVLDGHGARSGEARLFRWRGRALGAPAQITLAHPDKATARSAIERCVAEVVRLEAVFSLYQGESEISQLNRDGRLADASLDLRLLLAESQRLGRLTGGAFDVTVQPLWRLYAAHFAAVGPDGDGPPESALASALRRVDYRQICIDGGDVGFLRSGMAVTLNGIAQGYITDRIAAILHNEGFDRVLADLGEIAALNPPAGEAGWRVRVVDSEGRKGNEETILLANRAIATSAGGATRFDRSGRYHHLFDPRTGRSALRHRSVSVISCSAALSDALSTALAILPPEGTARLLRAAGAEQAIFRNDTGQERVPA